MGKKKIIIVLYIVFGIAYNSNGQKLDNKTKRSLKDYALCSCLIEAYRRDSIDLKDVSIPVLYEMSNYGINIYHRKKIDSLTAIIVDDISPLQSGDYGNKKAVIFNCIQYYKGQRLEKLIAALNKAKDKE